ncbi:MAG: hypothetical protein MJZ57_06905 [Bacteroidales bacterium]|nr:hypothetical protein [Bacteroidales bacterium]
MKEAIGTEKNRTWLVWLSIIAVLVIGVGIFFYYNFLRQGQSELIEAVPTDALFLFEINDNETWVKETPTIEPYLNEMFGTDAMDAYETVNRKLPKGKYDIVMSGHPGEQGLHLLFNTRIDKATFKRLLRSLSIDPANYQTFEQYKIYTYGTNLKSLKFVYFNHILTLSDDIELVQKAVIQHTHPKNMLSDTVFKKMYALTEKNQKQNWLLINTPAYFDFLGTFFNNAFQKEMYHLRSESYWSAFQIKISQNELFLSGYCAVTPDKLAAFQKLTPKSSLPENLLPAGTCQYYKAEHSGYTTCSFDMLADSVHQYHFFGVIQDTLHPKFRPLGNEEQAEIFRAANPSGIYSTTDSAVHIDIPDFKTERYACFCEYNGYYLFAPSAEALAAYTQNIERSGNIKKNRFYSFSDSNMASSSLTEFTFFNQSNGQLNQILSEKGKQSRTAKEMRICSFTCTNVAENFTTINLYFNFVQ